MPERISTYAHDGLIFDVLDAGPLDGPPVVLLHGFPERASHWDAVAARLHDGGFRTLAPDQRGYSPGARPRSRTAYRLGRLVGDIRALAAEVGGPVHVVGHDWGAVVAWSLADRHPQVVRTLTTVSVPHPTAFARSLLTSSQALRSSYVLLAQPPGLVEAAARFTPGLVSTLLRGAGLDEEDLERFHTEIVEYGALPGALGWYRALPWDVGRPTGRVQVPTTHVWSDGDQALARRGAELTAEYVEGPYELRVLEGVSHWIPLKAPELLAGAVLERLNGPGGGPGLSGPDASGRSASAVTPPG